VVLVTPHHGTRFTSQPSLLGCWAPWDRVVFFFLVGWGCGRLEVNGNPNSSMIGSCVYWVKWLYFLVMSSFYFKCFLQKLKYSWFMMFQVYSKVIQISLVVQTVKNLPAMQETQVWSLCQEDPLEKGTATHSSILAWRIPWTKELGGLQSMGPQRVRHD